MIDGYDFSELTRLERDLLKQATLFKKGKYTKQFLRKESKKLRKLIIKNARSRVNEKTGKFLEGIKKGKVYNYRPEQSLAIRVYGGAPAYHLHLLEHGHRIVSNGQEKGFVQGKFFFRDSETEFQSEYYKDIEKFIDGLLDKGFY